MESWPLQAAVIRGQTMSGLRHILDARYMCIVIIRAGRMNMVHNKQASDDGRVLMCTAYTALCRQYDQQAVL